MDDKSLVGGTLTPEEGLSEAFEYPNLENYDALGDLDASHSPSLGDRRVASGRSTAEMTENISALDRPFPDDLKAVTDSNANDVSSLCSYYKLNVTILPRRLLYFG